MAKKGRINTLPKSTADGRKRGPAAGNKRLQRELMSEKYARAKSQGQGDKFLSNHPKFARKLDQPRRATNRMKDPTGKRIAQDELAQQKEAAQQQITMQNATTSGPLGSEQTIIGPDGRPIHTQTLSDEQQQILNQGQDITQAGQQQAQQLVGGYQRFGQTGSPEERARIEDEVYNRLTRNVDRDYQQEFDQMEQRMFNRGIALDPSNPAYKREMDALNEKYGTIKENARQNAVSMGGQELQREFGMGLQSHQQGMQDMGTLQQQGTGLLMPNFQGFQAPQMNYTPAGQVEGQLANTQLQGEMAIKLKGMAGGEEEQEMPPIVGG